jgi:hypothetical protein
VVRIQRAVRNIACAAAVACVAVPCEAQSPGWGDSAPFANFFLTLGNVFTNTGPLNTRFESTNFDAMANHGYSLGAGFYIPFGRMLFGGEYNGTDFGYESNPQGRTNKMAGNYWQVTVGYAVISTWRFSVFPYLGIGQGTTRLTVSDPAGGATISSSVQNPLFNDILTSPGSRSVMDGTYLVVQPAIGIDYLLLRSTTSTAGVTLGLRAGSSITPHRTAWRYQGNEVAGAPDAGAVGSFVRVIIGVGGFKLNKDK